MFERGPAARRDAVTAGQIGKLWGLADVRIGDTIGVPAARGRAAALASPPPTLETVVRPGRRRTPGALHAALAQLAEQDPLINLRQDDVRQRDCSVSLYGEVQKEVIQATLAGDFGLEVDFRETTTICIERPVGTGAAVEIIDTPPQPVPGHDRAADRTRRRPGRGRDVPAGDRAGLAAARLPQGDRGDRAPGAAPGPVRLAGHRLRGHADPLRATGRGRATRTRTFDKSMSSTAGDFRNLTPLVLMAALRQAGHPGAASRCTASGWRSRPTPAGRCCPCWPGCGPCRGRAGHARPAVPAGGRHPGGAGRTSCSSSCPALTRGEGVLESAFDHYQPVRGPYPSRPRTDHNPLNREEYLLRVARRVAAR